MPVPVGVPFRRGNTFGKQQKKEKYAGYVRDAEDLMAAYLPDVAAAAIDIAMGNAVEHLINHKTGEVHEIPVNPATRMKAITYVADRIMGKPEQQQTHELGEAAQGAFQVLLGVAAVNHWSGALPEPVEAGFSALPAPVEEEPHAEP